MFVTAKPGSGKGILGDGRKLIDQINKEKVETYINDLQQYETDITACEEDDSCKQNYVRPQSDRLIIPANSSTAALMKAIKENGGYIVLFESEADTLANTMAKEWGNFDDMLRKAFHHEAISSLRKQEDELIEIENPKISLILSGTPNQLTKLIQSAENGLLSRFLYYAFELEKKWISPFGKSQKTKFDMLEKLSNEAVELYNFNLDNPFEMEFSETQVKEFDNFLGNIYEGKLENDYESGVIARMGLILFRICLTLTAIRRFESQCKKELVVCSDKDFNIAKSIIETSIAHSRSALNYIESRKVVSGGDLFFDKLPNGFKRSQANKIGKEIGIAERTVNNRLKKLISSGKLESPKKGEYLKAKGNVAKVANAAVVAS